MKLGMVIDGTGVEGLLDHGKMEFVDFFEELRLIIGIGRITVDMDDLIRERTA